MVNLGDFNEMRYPKCFVDEDLLAARKQRRHRLTLLIVGIVAVLLEVLSWLLGLTENDELQFAARALFAVAVGFLGWELLNSSSKKLEIPWYDARAAAESIKTVYWRYIMKAEPFDSAMSRSDSEQQLLQRVHGVLTGLGKNPAPTRILIEKEVLDWAWEVRNADLLRRMEIYRRGRLQDQARWYAAKSQLLGKYAKQAAIIAITAAFIAFASSIVSFWIHPAGSLSEVSFELSVVVFGYAAIRNFRRDSRVYEFTRQEIEIAAEQINERLSPYEWARVIDEIEEVFSREHVTWQASHSGEIRRAQSLGNERLLD